MDNNIYNLVKNAMKNGVTVEDLISDINKAAEELQKPKTPVKDTILKNWSDATKELKNCGLTDNSGIINRHSLTELIALYLIQRGLEPDQFTKSKQELVEIINICIESMWCILHNTSKISAAVTDKDIDDMLRRIFDHF